LRKIVPVQYGEGHPHRVHSVEVVLFDSRDQDHSASVAALAAQSSVGQALQQRLLHLART
jgi:hypothetical protein